VSPADSGKPAAFRRLHEGDPFVIPNPSDAGSAKVLEALGFKALATTSSGFAFTLGRPDGGVTLDEVLTHIRALDAATSLPVSADLENGYGPSPDDAAHAVRSAAEAGAAGGSIEDWDAEQGIYELELAVERIAAAAQAARESGTGFVLTARAENHIRGNPDLEDTKARLAAYERAGADVVFAPGLRTLEDIREVSQAASKPLNVLAHRGITVRDAIQAGAQRISLGGSLTWTAVEAMASAAEQIRDAGDLSVLASPARIREWLSG